MQIMLDIGRCLSIFDTHKVWEAGCVSLTGRIDINPFHWIHYM